MSLPRILRHSFLRQTKKSGETRPGSLLICLQIDTQYKNLKHPIQNTQLSQKEVGKYPFASNPQLELCDSCLVCKTQTRCESFLQVTITINQVARSPSIHIYNHECSENAPGRVDPGADLTSGRVDPLPPPPIPENGGGGGSGYLYFHY